MNFCSKLSCALLVLLIAASTQSSVAWARPYLTDPAVDGQLLFSAEYRTGVFQEEFSSGVSSRFMEAGAYIPVSTKMSLVAKVPFMRVENEYVPYLENYDSTGTGEISLGNIYLGVGFNPETNIDNIAFNFGVYVPSAGKTSSGNIGVATLSNYLHPEKLVPNTWTFHANVGKKFLYDGGIFLAADFGTNLFLTTGGSETEADFGVLYGFGVGIEQRSLAMTLEFGGAWTPSGEYGFDDSSRHVFAWSIDYKTETIRPGLFYALPVDEFGRNTLHGIVGARVVVVP